MNPAPTSCRGSAFTLIEMLCVMAIIAILAALLLPVLSQGKAGAKRIQCVGNLRQAGIAFHIFAHDHRGKFPMHAPASEGGSEEFVQSGYHVGGEFYFSFRHFQPLANELGSTRILVCPADSARSPAANFAKFNNVNLSYLVGVNAEPGNVNSILSGDRNLTNNWGGNPTILQASPGSLIRWNRELHGFKGNLLYADGHVDELNGLRFAQDKNTGGDLLLPSIKQSRTARSPGNDGLAVAQNPPTGRAISNPSLTGGSAEVGHQTSAKNGSQLRQGTSTSSPVEADTATTRPETNLVAVTTQGSPTRTAQDSGGSPFMRWFADLAQQIVHGAKWLLWLLLLLLLIALVALRLRQLARRKNT